MKFLNDVQLPRDPDANLESATKQYVDARAPKISVGTSAPGSPSAGDVWIDTN